MWEISAWQKQNKLPSFIDRYQVVFFSFFFLWVSFLWCSQTDDHPQQSLAIFGYRPDMKVRKIRIFQYFGYLLQPVVEIWQSLFLVWKSGELGPLSFFKNIICMCQNNIFKFRKCKKNPNCYLIVWKLVVRISKSTWAWILVLCGKTHYIIKYFPFWFSMWMKVISRGGFFFPSHQLCNIKNWFLFPKNRNVGQIYIR